MTMLVCFQFDKTEESKRLSS